MMHVFRPLVALVAVATLAACTLPPITTPETSFTVKYETFIPSMQSNVSLPLFPAVPEVAVPASTIPVPKEAKSVKLETVMLNLKLKNTGPLPLKLKIYLSNATEDPYTKAPLGDATGLDLPKGGLEVTKTFPLDVALLQAESLKLGIRVSSPGVNEPVTFKPEDAITVTQSVKVTAKLL